MVRLFGSTGRSRRLRIGTAIAACTALVMLMSVPAMAVHDQNFELDGNVLVDAGGPAFDWASFFNAAGAEAPVLPDASRPGFDASGFDRDFNTNANGSFSTSDNTTFATGSKDTLPITPGWQCNTDNNVLSKSDVMNAYAVSYVVPSGTEAGDEIMYFALERNANTGTGNVGFWFLQDGTVDCVSGGGATAFTGNHVDGDLLIVSEFSQGGAVSTIFAYKWSDALGTVDPNPVAQGASCTTAPANDDICARVNTGTITTPWLTANKQDGVGHSLRVSEFFEGGINLTDSSLGGKCFNTFIGDTRSSTSLTATIFDYSLGQLGACTSGIVTTPQAGDGGAIPSTIGTAARVDVRDHAVITVNGATTFGGAVKFFLCGPLDLASTTTCSAGGVQIGTPLTGEPVTGAAGTASLNSDTATLTSAGRYCWRAEYSGDASVGVPGSTDSTAGECFSIGPVTPTLTTTAGSDVTVGSPITDTASLTGTAKQPGTDGVGPGGTINATAATQAAAGGTISVVVKGPDDCDDSGLTVTPSSVTVSGDNASYGPFSATPTELGTYTFVATYSGNSPNTNGAAGSCPDGTEEVTVGGQAGLSTAQDWLPNDTATLTGPTNLNGTLTFTLYPTADCTGTAVAGQTYNVTVTDAASGSTFSTSNATFKVTLANAGNYSWLVHYVDTNLADPADTCETTSLTIDNDVLVGTP
jgi:hypothetical protein